MSEIKVDLLRCYAPNNVVAFSSPVVSPIVPPVVSPGEGGGVLPALPGRAVQGEGLLGGGGGCRGGPGRGSPGNTVVCCRRCF